MIGADDSIRPPLPRRVEAALGSAAGALAGLVIGALEVRQGMMSASGVGVATIHVGLVWYVVVAAVVGAAFGGVIGYQAGALGSMLATGLLFGVLAWVVWWLTLVPLLAGGRPTWSAQAAGAAFADLVGNLQLGALTAALFYAGAVRWERQRRPSFPPVSERSRPPRVVILGGGFGGVAAARRLERLFPRDHMLDITLVSESNYLLFTPMLAEVASSALQAQNISAPVRAACRYTRFLRARVEAVDPAGRVVSIRRGAAGRLDTIEFDHLVVALGSVSTSFDLPGVGEHSFTLKTLEDATALRSHVLELLERADLEHDPGVRSRQLTFVVAGGGFAGTEMIAELFDLVHGVRRYYPSIGVDEPRFVLVHSGDRILPELGLPLAEYALRKLRARGIEFVLETRVAGARADATVLATGEEIPTSTLVWTTGSAPHPAVRELAAATGEGAGVMTDASLRIIGFDRAWAIGDCARIPDSARPGSFYPPTAQHAQRQGKVVADNIAASLRGQATREFRFEAIGTFVALGHRTAVGEVRGRHFSGLAGWLMWRGIYLGKLPGLDKKLRVLIDWGLDLALPRDTVITDRPASVPESDPSEPAQVR